MQIASWCMNVTLRPLCPTNHIYLCTMSMLSYVHIYARLHQYTHVCHSALAPMCSKSSIVPMRTHNRLPQSLDLASLISANSGHWTSLPCNTYLYINCSTPVNISTMQIASWCINMTLRPICPPNHIYICTMSMLSYVHIYARLHQYTHVCHRALATMCSNSSIVPMRTHNRLPESLDLASLISANSGHWTSLPCNTNYAINLQSLSNQCIHH